MAGTPTDSRGWGYVNYDEMSTKKYDDDKFTVMMVVDESALLSYILNVCLGSKHGSFSIRYQDISVLYRDALLLENQLPYQLLLELMKMMRSGPALS